MNKSKIKPRPDRAFALANAQSFDLHMYSDSPNVRRLGDELFQQHIREPNRSSLVTIRPVLDCVVLNLVDAYEKDPKRYVRLSLRYDRYRRSRYNPLEIGRDNLRRIIDRLLKAGLLEFEKGIPARQGFVGGKQSRIRATTRLMEVATRYQVSSASIRHCHDETIILRGPKQDGYKPLIDYKETPATRRMRQRLRVINERIAAANKGLDIYLDHRDAERLKERLLQDPERDPVDLTKIRLRRIFNNGSFKEGGRFYHGWWQQLPREFRCFVQINGRVTTELDYSAMHIGILYAQVGLSLNADPYMLPGATDKERPIIKTALNAAINAEDLKSAEAAIRYQAIRTPLPKSYSDACALLAALLDRHDPIRKYIGSGEGLRGQYIDSKIAERVMLGLGERQTIVLPVHDSFIVEHDRVDELADAMRTAYKEEVGRSCKVDVKTPIWLTDNYDQPPPLDFRDLHPDMDTRTI
ncbi:hypothetical protein [Lentisalinibacter salinarum]|uniref:hypothetical protein n=1 Tax=Lentisalinibacter salinarum TaxID=2992239 RepID=UPI00386FE924